MSTDPALSEYIPGAPINDEVKKKNSELPGMGGVFNTVNLHLYHYAGNNPVKYVDPDGREIVDDLKEFNYGSENDMRDLKYNSLTDNHELRWDMKPTMEDQKKGVSKVGNDENTSNLFEGIGQALDVLNLYLNVTGKIAKLENIPNLKGFNTVTGTIGYGAAFFNAYGAAKDPSIDAWNDAIGGFASAAAPFPFGFVAGPTAEYTAKGIGESAKWTAKLNHMLKTEADKVYQFLFNFAARYK